MSHDSADVSEVSYEPHHLNDLTLHYRSSLFHVHALILHRESPYFAGLIDAVKDDETCTFSDSCSSDRRCLTLPDEFGGFETSAQHMKTFLDHLYDPARLLLSHVTNDAQAHDGQLARVQFDMCSDVMVEKASTREYVAGYITDVHGGFVTVTFNTSGTLSRLPITSPRLLYSTKRSCFSTRQSALQGFLRDHEAIIRLAHYFDCQIMLQSYQHICRQSVSEAVETKDFDPLWQMLVLAELLHWDSIKQSIVTALRVDFDFQSSSSWEKSAMLLSSKTLVDILREVAV